jgi:hypothetical protein
LRIEGEGSRLAVHLGGSGASLDRLAIHTTTDCSAIGICTIAFALAHRCADSYAIPISLYLDWALLLAVQILQGCIDTNLRSKRYF